MEGFFFFFVPEASSRKVTLYLTTNTCIPQLKPTDQIEAGGEVVGTVG